MVASTHLSPRGYALARTFAAAFEALKEHSKAHGGESVVLAGQVAAHLRSAFPMEAIATVVPADRAEDASEFDKLRAEVDAMRPVYVAAIVWAENGDPSNVAALMRAVNGAAEVG